MISVNNNSCKVTQMVRPALKDDFSKECDYCKGTGVSKVNKIACEGYVFKPFQTDDLMSKEYLIECPICKGRGVKTE